MDAKDLSRVFVNHRAGRTYYGLHQPEIEKVNYAQLKAHIAKDMGLKTNRLVQVVSSSKPFSAEGTRQAREFLTPFLTGDHIKALYSFRI